MTKTLEAVANQKRLGNVKTVANLCAVSQEHIRRLNDRGAMPKAIRLGRSLRWDLNAVEDWIEAGCPNVGQKGGRR